MKHDAQSEISTTLPCRPQCGRAGRLRLLLLAGICVLATGCHGTNHFHAESMPQSLLVGSRSNPQEADLSRLASANGGSEIIGPGDILNVTIAAGLSEDDQLELPIRVDDKGEAALPRMGKVQLAGFEPQAAEALIRMKAIEEKMYINPTVTVMMLQKRMNRVRVLGAVLKPGVYELPPNSSDIVSAIAAAEGLAEDAGENVEIRNPVKPGSQRPAIADADGGTLTHVSSTSAAPQVSGGMTSYTVNLVSAAKSSSENYLVHDGGVVMVEKRDPAPVQVLGLVRSPGRYEFPIGQDLYLLDALALAGGISNQVANKVYVIRPLANSKDPAVIEVSLRTAKKSGQSNIRLAPGDVVSVEQTPATVLMEALQIIRFSVTGSAFSGF